jgi:hypothetical protein
VLGYQLDEVRGKEQGNRVRMDKRINYDCSQLRLEARGSLVTHSRHWNLAKFRAKEHQAEGFDVQRLQKRAHAGGFLATSWGRGHEGQHWLVIPRKQERGPPTERQAQNQVFRRDPNQVFRIQCGRTNLASTCPKVRSPEPEADTDSRDVETPLTPGASAQKGLTVTTLSSWLLRQHHPVQKDGQRRA